MNRVCTSFDHNHIALVEEMSAQDFALFIEQLSPVTDEDGARRLLSSLKSHYKRLTILAGRDLRGIEKLGQSVGEGLVRVVPLFKQDVHDLGQLLKIGDHLVAA